MGIIELVLIAIGLSMDAFAVSVCKGIETKKANIKQILLCGVWFGGFQGLMPFIGYILGSRFEFIINKVAPWIAFGLLTLIGVNMLREAFSAEEEETRKGFDVKSMLILALATSIDALAVGITFVAVPVRLFETTDFVNSLFGFLLIAVTTFGFGCVGVKIGNVFGSRYKSGAEAAGGFVLVFIGLKILLEAFGVIDFMNNGDVLFGLLVPFAGTIAGAALVFVREKTFEEPVKNILNGMAGGIMLACSMWTLLYPSVHQGKVVTAAVGFIIGIVFQFILDKTVPHIHVHTKVEEGPSNHITNSVKVMLSEIIHHIPEGMAIGVMYAGILNGSGDIGVNAAVALTFGITVQNIPEGTFVSSPLRDLGEQKGKSFLMGVISGIVQPIVGIATIILLGIFPGILLFAMALIAGAMTFLVIEECIPSMCVGKHADKGTLSFAMFFGLMMVLTFYTGI